LLPGTISLPENLCGCRILVVLHGFYVACALFVRCPPHAATPTKGLSISALTRCTVPLPHSRATATGYGGAPAAPRAAEKGATIQHPAGAAATSASCRFPDGAVSGLSVSG
jgi:hypothetical protein